MALWRFRPRRRAEAGFTYVYVNQAGTARECSPGERNYLSQEFRGDDGGRPYIKSTYESRDGWGSTSGYIARRLLPARISVLPVNPDYDTQVSRIVEDFLEAERAAGNIIIENADGSITCRPNPDISREEQFALNQKYQLELQRKREQLALMGQLTTDT